MQDPGADIGWDLGRMAEMAALLDRRSDRLHSARLRCLESCERPSQPPPPLRRIVLAAEWAVQAADALRRRREALQAAEAELIWHLSRRSRVRQFGPELRTRSIEAISADLDAALDAAAAPDGAADGRRIAELVHELAIAEHHRLLMAPAPPAPELLADLVELINYFGYQIARIGADDAVDWRRVFAARDEIRASLDESWFGDVGRRDLQRITATLATLSGSELDTVIGLLTDDELYRWFHELDGVRGGNLGIVEETELFELIAGRASPATLLRLATAERGSRFAEIAAAVRTSAPPEVAMEFIELCAAGATGSEQLLIAALAGLAALDAPPRRIVLASLHEAGLLEPLAATTATFVESTATERTEPIIVEFFRGLLLAVRDGAAAMADLTVAGLVDRHRFRQAWSALGEATGLVVTDPVGFVAAVIDIEMMRRNPARWLGASTADLATLGLGKLARLGRLGRAARTIAEFVKRLGEARILRAGKLQVEAGHISDLIGRLTGAADVLELRALLDQVAAVENVTAQLETTITELPKMSAATAIAALQRVIGEVTDQVAEVGARIVPPGAPPQMIASALPAT